MEAYAGIYVALVSIFSYFIISTYASPGGNLAIKFVKYDNPSGRKWSGGFCDFNLVYVSACDPMFDVTVTPTDTNAGSKKEFSSEEYENKNNVNFGSNFGNGVPNPFYLYFKFWPKKGYNIQITIRDIDLFGSWELQDKMAMNLPHSPGEEKMTELVLRGLRTKTSPSQLTINYKVICSRSYYGLSCTTYCEAQNGPNGHYTCNKKDGSKICNANYYDVSKSCKVFCLGRDNDTGHYTCHPDTGAFICIPGWTDTSQDCRVDIDECLSSPCQNEGTCLNLLNKYECKCKTGTSGTNCEFNRDECAHSPCQNGGICIDGIGKYFCECRKGFNGTNCEIQVNECDKSPCHNGGTCVDVIGSFKCICPQDYAGPKCAIHIHPCAQNTCFNNGTCSVENGTKICICPLGFEGTDCETKIDFCQNFPCKNNGTCSSELTNFECNCTKDYIGETCDREIDKCTIMECENGATCGMIQGQGYVCHCAPGYEGSLCENKKDFCNDSPCENGGKCTSMLTAFACECLPGFIGNNCELDVRTTTTSIVITSTISDLPAKEIQGTNSKRTSPLVHLPYILAAFGVFVIIIVIVVLIFTQEKIKNKKRRNMVRHFSMENHAYAIANGKMVENDIYETNPGNRLPNMVENDIYGDGSGVEYSKQTESINFDRGQLRISGLSYSFSKS